MRTRRSGKPSRSSITPALRESTLATPVPMVPKPIRPTPTPASVLERGDRPAAQEPALAQEAADAPHRLPDAVAVLDQGEAHETLAGLAEADARETATFASRSSRLENSSDPSEPKGSGIGAQTNMVARGFSIFH
jgi:hypothetical protein